MYKINFENPIHVHFIGIGGISMSGLAEILLKENFTISGQILKNLLFQIILKQWVPLFSMARKLQTL